jgi:hypothetical protein
MLDVHHEICRLAVRGLSQVQIAEEVGVTLPVVGYTLNSPLGQQKLELLRLQRDLDATSINSRLHSAANRGMDLLESIIEDRDKSATVGLKTKVALELLDRAGYGKIQRTVNMNLEGKLSESDIDELTQRALQVKGTVVDDGLVSGAETPALTEDGSTLVPTTADLAAKMIEEIDNKRREQNSDMNPKTPYQGLQLKVVGA